MLMHEFSNLPLDDEMVASLRLETSALRPEVQLRINDTALRIKDSMVDSYQDYIPPETLSRVEHLEDRVFIMDSDTFDAFDSSWHGDDSETTTRQSVMGVSYAAGDVIAMTVDEERSWNLMTEDAQKELTDLYGADAKGITNNIRFTDNLAHEIAHKFQDSSLPRPFLEAAVRYYQQRVVTDLGFGHLIVDLDEQRIEFYAGLLDKYGDRVHSVFFGTEQDLGSREQIVKEFTPSICARLFPEGKGL